MEYKYFKNELTKITKRDQKFYNDLLITILLNPERYTGIFRLSNINNKIIQNITQSQEIKFGYFIENIITDYIELMGYKNLNKNLGIDEIGNYLLVDQIFSKDKTIYIIEQKIRDDHDSTKKRGQIKNFKRKYILASKLFPDYKINASMWFIDDTFKKNKNYYISEIKKHNNNSNIDINIFYGKNLFINLFNRIDVWEEICEYLLKNKLETDEKTLSIPDFDTSEEFFIALKNLKELGELSTMEIKEKGYPKSSKNLYKKLFGNDKKFINLRKELFPTEYNLKRVTK